MKVDKAVQFDSNDREKDAQLIFTLASKDAQKHLSNLSSLMEYLTNEEFLNQLEQSTSIDELKELLRMYS